MLRGFCFARRRDPRKFEDSVSSSLLLLPVRGFLLPLLHLLLLRLLCEQERKKESGDARRRFWIRIWHPLSSLCGDTTSVLLRKSARSKSTIMAKVQRQRRKRGGRRCTKSRRETPRSKKNSLTNFHSLISFRQSRPAGRRGRGARALCSVLSLDMCSWWLLTTVQKKKSTLFCSRMHAESRFVSLFVHLWKPTVLLAKVRVEDITPISSRGLMSLGTKGSLPSYEDQRIPCVLLPKTVSCLLPRNPCYRCTVFFGVPKIGQCLECILSLLTEISLSLLSVVGQRGEDLMSRGNNKAPREPVVDARNRRKRRKKNRSVLATLPHPNIPLIVMDSTDDDEEEDEDVLPFSLNRSFKPSFPDEEGITLEDVEAVVGTIPWAKKENPCERPLAKKTASQDGGKGQRSKTPDEGDFVDDVAPKPRTVKAKILDESKVYPDFELVEDSGSGDSEAEDEQKDPLDWEWKEFAIMS